MNKPPLWCPVSLSCAPAGWGRTRSPECSHRNESSPRLRLPHQKCPPLRFESGQALCLVWEYSGRYSGEYIGNTINCRTYTPSFKSKKSHLNPPDKILRFEGTHEPLIALDTWEIVQRVRQGKRRPTKLGRQDILFGLVYCKDCGSRHYFCRCGSWDESRYTFVCGKTVRPTPLKRRPCGGRLYSARSSGCLPKRGSIGVNCSSASPAAIRAGPKRN